MENATVQVALLPDVRVVGAQVSELKVGDAVREIDAVRDTPLSVAVTVAVLSAVMVPAVAVKVACDCPALTVTEAGMVRLGLLSERAMAVAADAALERVTVHVALPPELSEEGEQVSEVSVGGEVPTLTVPPLEVIGGKTEPVEEVAITLLIAIGREGFNNDERLGIAVTMASTPFPMRVEFSPQTKQTTRPLEALQERDLPVVSATGPAATITELKSAAE